MIYGIVESLSCPPESNITLWVKYIGIKKKRERETYKLPELKW